MFRGNGLGRRAGHRGIRPVLAALASMTLLLSLAGTAAAHEPSFSLTCEDGLKVDLLWYNGSNTVDVQIDGVAVDGSPFTFGDDYHGSWSLLPATKAHTAKVVVWAHDDPDGAQGWSRTWEDSIGACEEPTPTPEETSTPVATSTPTGTVEAETGTPRATRTPRVTPPSTDGLAEGTGGTGTGLPLVLVLLAGSSLALLPGSWKRAHR